MLKPIDVPVMWSFKQAEVETRLKKFTIMNWVKSGKVKFIRVGAGQRGKILINAQSLCDYMERGEQA
ncbi:MAG: hypothetical protein K2H90_09625 [Oscillospiraceae bacterium]|nr:hypothetical protein [Oscillospiraceae bacterium]